MTKDDLLGHMEYMKRQEKLCDEIVGTPTWVIPSASGEQAIEFYDDCGMFRIRDCDHDNRYMKELFRYDQVEDAATSGLARYTRLADEAESKIDL